MHVPDFLHRNARLMGDVEAVRDAERRRTFGELERRAGHVAAGLARLGVAPGDRVALLASNRVEFVELYFASAMLGCVLVPINGRLRAGEIAFQIEDAEARAAIVEAEYRPLVEACRTQDAGRTWIALGDAGEPPQGWVGYESLALAPESDGDGDHPARRDPTPDAALVQMYTSGTTGTPKGALLTHRNVVAMVLAWLYEIKLRRAPDRFLLVMPLFHVGGLLHTMASVAAGAHLLLVREFRPAPILDALVAERVTHVLFVPAMVQWLLQEKGTAERRFPDLRRIVYGGAPMPIPVLERALQVFGCEFVQGYGLTETTGVVTVLRPADHVGAGRADAERGGSDLGGADRAGAERGDADRAGADLGDAGKARAARLASAGRAVLTCEVRVVDETGREVEPGTVGEIVARGEQVTRGYWKRPEATAESLRDGWFHTGDLGLADADGYVTIVDRLKDMILVAGENVYPSEVEAVLVRHAAVLECAVIGIPHETWGEEVLAVVALRAGDEATPAELIRHCRTSLARFKCPTKVELVDALPRNAGGKVLKRDLRAPHWAGRAKRV